MKKIFGITLMMIMAFLTLSACKNTNQSGGTNHTSNSSNLLIAYFSCTGTTKGVAEHIEAKTGGALYEIAPEIPYTKADHGRKLARRQKISLGNFAKHGR